MLTFFNANNWRQVSPISSSTAWIPSTAKHAKLSELEAKDAYGEYIQEGLMDLPKNMFFNGDGEFDSERVYVLTTN